MWPVTLTLVLFATVSLNDAFLPNAMNKLKFNEKFGITNNYQSKASRHSYYTQWRDHFDLNDYTTFDQKIYINDQNYFFGPVFILVGSQSTEYEYWMENSLVSQINQEQLGVVYGIEHRFYGESQPTDDLSVESLSFLTIDQTLADIAGFTQFLRTELGDNKFILFGYGDGAQLATLAHQNYPDLFDGVWAVGAPTYIKFNFFDYFPDFQNTLTVYNSGCASIVDNGLVELGDLFDSGNINRIHELFGFQNRINMDNTNEVRVIFYTITSLLASNLEYGTQMDLTDLCAALLDSVSQGLTPVESIAREIRLYTQNINPSWDDSMAQLSETSWDSTAAKNGERQFWYTACTARGFFKSSLYFIEQVRTRFPIDLFLTLCYEAFGFGSTDVVLAHSSSNAKYRLKTNLPNVIFTHGGLDPFRIVGQTTDLNPSSPGVVIPGFGKTFELLGTLPQEYLTTEMVEVRNRVRSYILSIIQS